MAIIDIADYHILRSLDHYYAHRPQIQAGSGLSDEVVVAQRHLQAQYDLVLAYYRAEENGLGRAAKLLDPPIFFVESALLSGDSSYGFFV